LFQELIIKPCPYVTNYLEPIIAKFSGLLDMSIGMINLTFFFQSLKGHLGVAMAKIIFGLNRRNHLHLSTWHSEMDWRIAMPINSDNFPLHR